MEKLRKAVNEIAYTKNLSKLPPLHFSLLPFLSLSSSFYKLALSIRHRFFLSRIHRLPVPVISVGNLTWGGNGKTPMVEFIALFFYRSGISPLVLSRVLLFSFLLHIVFYFSMILLIAVNLLEFCYPCWFILRIILFNRFND